MGLSLRDGASVFQLECDRSRARYGVIWLAFRFDPPVAADVLGEFDGIGSAMLVSARVPHTYLDRLSQGRLLCNKKIVSAEKGDGVGKISPIAARNRRIYPLGSAPLPLRYVRSC